MTSFQNRVIILFLAVAVWIPFVFEILRRYIQNLWREIALVSSIHERERERERESTCTEDFHANRLVRVAALACTCAVGQNFPRSYAD